MASAAVDSNDRLAGAGHSGLTGFLSVYVFSRDHKIIGLQFLFSALVWFLIGGLLALAIRWQIAWPWSDMPRIGKMLLSGEGGRIAPEFYTMLFTMDASVMVFLVIIPILVGAFGNYLIPLMIGADAMAIPMLNMLSYWFLWPAFIFFGFSFFAASGGPPADWASYPLLSLTLGNAQTCWLLGVMFVGISLMIGSINYIATILQMRAPGMSMFRMPMTIWGMLITATFQVFALPILTAAGLMQVLDRVAGTRFFMPEGWSTVNAALASGGGQSLLWQQLFWFYSHPAVYIMILPAMGMVSDIISTFGRKPLVGYKTMVYSISGIAGIGFIVWGYHMFVSGMNPVLGVPFVITTMMIALPCAIKTLNWLRTIWGAKIQFTTPMLFALSFVSMFIIGGLSSVFMAATPVDQSIYDTYSKIAHFHYVLFAGTAMAVFGGVYYWFPKMFGRMMNDGWGKVHFLFTFLFLNGSFFPMHILGLVGFSQRLAAPYYYETFKHLMPLNQFMLVCVIGMIAVQAIFVANFFYSIFLGPKCGRNPWKSNSLEWSALSPPGLGNFDVQPVVFRGPYEYGSPEVDDDYYPQIQPPPEKT